MKKVVNINLGGKKFTIDEDAYETLDNYLKSINRKFSNSSGFEDIVDDIESRIAELFDEQNDGSTIITMKNVDNVMKRMGTPSDFGEDNISEDHGTHDSYKRLFRDPEDKVIAGVASGLSAYYGMSSPLMFRALILFFALSGIGILPYFLLWVFVPEAKTSSDRLAMYGEKINIDSIANSVEDSLTDIKDTLEDLGKNIKKNYM